jgi:hypothetical protein
MPESSEEDRADSNVGPGGDVESSVVARPARARASATQAEAAEALPFARTLLERAEAAPRVDIHGPTLPSPDPMNHPARLVSSASLGAAGAQTGAGPSASPRAKIPASKPAPSKAGARPPQVVWLSLLIAGVFAMAGILGFLALRVWSARDAAPQEIRDVH